jgi:hypothetical protein
VKPGNQKLTQTKEIKMKHFALIVLLCVVGCNHPEKFKFGDSVIIKSNKKIGVIDGYSGERGQAYIVKYAATSRVINGHITTYTEEIVSEDIAEEGLLPAPAEKK